MGDPKLNPSLGMKVTLATMRNIFSRVPQMSTTTFYEMWSEQRGENLQSQNHCKSLVSFDIREKKERDISFIQGSVWINSLDSYECNVKKVQEILKSKIVEINPGENHQLNVTVTQPEIDVVVYCSIGYRSNDLIKQLLEIDLLPNNMAQVKVNLYNLEGSLFKWANEDKPMIDLDSQPTKFVHPYNALWGKLLNKNRRKASL